MKTNSLMVEIGQLQPRSADFGLYDVIVPSKPIQACHLMKKTLSSFVFTTTLIQARIVIEFIFVVHMHSCRHSRTDAKRPYTHAYNWWKRRNEII